ncbi:MAG: ATP-dependent helicase [Akkermansia sp.]
MVRRYILNNPPPDKGLSPSGIDYSRELNDEQLAAVTSPDGAALVIAGAGSGKTRTLTYRVAWLIDQGVHPHEILLLTFTNKAAKEMLERVKSLVPTDLSALWSGTFHSIGNRILRRHATELGYTSSFSIMDTDDRRSMLKAIIKELKLNDKVSRFPKPEVISSIFSLAENKGKSIKQMLDSEYAYLSEHNNHILNIHTRYVQRKKETNSMDFDDLLTKLVELLENNEYLRGLYAHRFRYILVDEYQDTNSLQDRFIDLLSGEHGNIMAVGDDAQSIYSWRGADMKHILSFSVKHPAARIYKIETNYRSVPEILNLSNAAIAANANRIDKNLHSVRKGGKMIPALIALNDLRTEANFIAQRMTELIDSGIDPRQIAVLYRAHFHSMELQMELTQQSIPFRITSGIRFFEQSHVKDVLAFIRFATNPRDELSFLRMVQLLPGMGPVTTSKLWQRWLALPENTLANTPKDLSENLSESIPPEQTIQSYSTTMGQFPVSPKHQKIWLQLCATLDELICRGKLVNPASMIFSIIEGVYDDYMQAEFDNYDQRRQDLLQLSSFAERFESSEDFLAQMSLLGNADDDTKDAKGEPITLSSIHQAKGLEWEVVFLLGLGDGMFPHQRALESGDDSELEEERRLFYVAITRAKDQLYMTYPRWNCKAYNGNYSVSPSRFLDDFPSNLVEEWQID